ncbi:DUF6173 family protein [uncultured Fusobacterium sp.]|jgi:hypothetical protein|uniref:DUF6173 family protein n=1 Tax=Fusobacterium TaxID=848 RepID=UPI001EF54D94|nr:DUF6173 family protein [Fusobacterium sp.]MDO5787916.1 DUF6173 family protein [Fusobacterium sp.]
MSKPKILTEKKVRREVIKQMENFPIEEPRDYNMADWKFEKLIEQIKDFEEGLDDDHEVALKLASFGSAIMMYVVTIGYQNPDMLYFYGFVDGQPAQLIQHMSQLNFLITSVEKIDKDKPARRIGFALPTLEKLDEIEQKEK